MAMQLIYCLKVKVLILLNDYSWGFKIFIFLILINGNEGHYYNNSINVCNNHIII